MRLRVARRKEQVVYRNHGTGGSREPRSIHQEPADRACTSSGNAGRGRTAAIEQSRPWVDRDFVLTSPAGTGRPTTMQTVDTNLARLC
jgi:hypothetical protein